MKQIIDEETGEVIEVEDKNEIAEHKLTETGVVSEKVYEMLETYLYYQEQFETFRYKLQKAMEDNGIKKWDNDRFIATVKDESLQKRIDIERLKDDGLYEKYIKLVPVKSSLQIRFKDERK